MSWQTRPAFLQAVFQAHDLPSRYPAWTGFLFIVLVYCIFYAVLLTLGNGLPYVMDNNESFSSLWHARNALEHGIGLSAGLADEVFSPHPEAHPYVHTHQGNFPRLFALLIYILGATSIESQIAITTFTVGLAAALMGYALLLRIGGALFATACMVAMVTDYVVIAQWQIVTYRVWHMFFLFSSMLAVHAMASPLWRRWLIVLFLNFAFLAYFELVFAAFVLVASALYAIVVLWRSPARIAGFWLLQTAGLAVGIGILIYQLTLYLGWEGLRQDVYLTFIARNQYENQSDLREVLREFYESHRAIFWYNLQDGRAFRTVGHFLASISFYDLQPHTPLLTATAVIVLGTHLYCRYVSLELAPMLAALPIAWATFRKSPVVVAGLLLLIHLLHKVARQEFGVLQWTSVILLVFVAASWPIVVAVAARGWLRGRARAALLNPEIGGLILAALILLTAVPSAAPHVSFERAIFDYSSLYVAYLLLYLVLFLDLLQRFKSVSARLDKAPSQISRQYTFVQLVIFGVLVAALLFIAIATPLPAGEIFKLSLTVSESISIVVALLGSAILMLLLYRGGESWLALIPVAVPALIIGTAVFSLHSLGYHQGYREVWSAISGALLPTITIPAMALGAVVASVYVASAGNADAKSPWMLVAFWASGFVAYVVVYILSPGYVFTGYRFRLVPFTAFHTVVLYGAALAILVRVACLGGTLTTENVRAAPRAWNVAGRVVAGGVALMMAIYWFSMQAKYIQLLPPDHFSIFKRLAFKPYQGASFVANSYAAPIAAYTGEWAYMDAQLNLAVPSQANSPMLLERSDEYLWFADRNTNPAYDTPRYYLCLAMQSMPGIASSLRQKSGERPAGCESSPLVQLAMSTKAKDAIPSPRLLEIDQEGPARVGFARWAILELTWK